MISAWAERHIGFRTGEHVKEAWIGAEDTAFVPAQGAEPILALLY